MAWDRTDSAIVFECDDCPEVVTCSTTEFSEAWSITANSFGWVTFKRTGRDWTQHCPKCKDRAAEAHRQYREDEARRDRIKARNAQ